MRAHLVPRIIALTIVTVLVLGAGSAGASPSQRVTGPPPSSNGASSMHLWLDQQTSRHTSATITITKPPTGQSVYFWALQATLVDAAGKVVAGAHLGLQWHPSHPGSLAVNFGGYDAQGKELVGTKSLLRSATGNPNTRDFAWTPRTAYRLVIARTASGWAGTITNLASGQVTTVRTLFTGAVAVRDAIVFTESFAPCDAPRTEVLWTGLTPTATATYQSVASGGCTNTSQLSAGGGVVQRTNGARTVVDGARLRSIAAPAVPA